MKKQFTTGLVLVLMVLFSQSCYYDNEEVLYPNSNCETGSVSFTNHILPLVQANCAISGCHVAGTGRTVLTDYVQIKGISQNGDMRQRVIQSKDMPPSGPLAACQIKTLVAWIEQGALNN